MKEEWKKVKLGEICEYVTSGGTPLASREDYYNPGTIPWLKTKEVNYCRITETENYISEKGLNNSSAKIIPENSVIMAMYGQGDTAGRVAINKIPLTTNQACCNLIINKEKADYNFVYYKLSTIYDTIVALKSGGAQPNLNAGKVKGLEITLPPLPTQQKIASVLSAYDDLIENNRRQIKLLEEAALKLYKEWFVKLNFPGHENIKIVDGIPEGWKEVAIGNLCIRVNAGGTPNRKKTEYWDKHEVKWFKTKELQDCWLFDAEEYISEKGLNNSSAKIFPENTILMAIYASPTLGRLGILTDDACCNQAALCMIADEEKISYQWLYLKLMELRDYFNSVARGAGQQNISGDVVKNKIVLVPEKKLMEEFTSITKPYFNKIKNCQLSIVNLQLARDKLLPKLMNGEIEV